MLPSLQLGPLAIQLSGLLILAGIWLGLSLAERHAARFGVKPADLSSLTLIALLAGLVGARLSFVLRYPAAFAANPLSIFSINPGLLDPFGGLAAALLAALIFGQRKHLPLWGSLDALTPALAVFMLFAGLAHLASGAAFGAPSTLPWALSLWGERRHPSQVYEIIAAATILALLWPGRAWARSARPGVYFLAFVAASAAARLFLEAFRGDSQLVFANLRAAQLAAWLALAGALFGIFILTKRKIDQAV